MEGGCHVLVESSRNICMTALKVTVKPQNYWSQSTIENELTDRFLVYLITLHHLKNVEWWDGK
jgi:hypothetical protein